MGKTKKERQLELLDKLLVRIGESDDVSATDNALWVQQRIAEIQNTEGDIRGLSKEDMLKANNIWARHAPPMKWENA